MDILYASFLILGFLAVVLLIEGLYLAWSAYLGPEARRVERRLKALSAGSADIQSSPLIRKRLLSETPAVERLLLSIPRVHVLDRFLLQSGRELTVARFLAISVGLASGAAVLLTVLRLPAIVVVSGACLPVIAWIAWIQRQRSQRMRMIELQLPDTLDMMARAMQAGHAFSSAMRLAGNEGPQPIAREFQTAFDEINFGVSVERALAHLAARVASNDLRYFVVAVVIQRETGGNLADILLSIAALIRERQRMVGTIRVLSAEGRVSAWILTLLPFLLAGALTLLNHDFAAKLWTDPVGLRMVSFALAMMAIGIWWMWRLVKIRV